MFLLTKPHIILQKTIIKLIYLFLKRCNFRHSSYIYIPICLRIIGDCPCADPTTQFCCNDSYCCYNGDSCCADKSGCCAQTQCCSDGSCKQQC
ncbi:hypothetical protein C2G38_96548 [Gigaspora rosea]|uniref:Uncharacterized protein n=1 Tax=Gigaspora rosea TaxID=44941 RepID=A0A397UVQ4_9GLOM|nr:hypothetical protein C2G38_96548 [Gigaspora rosea]